MRLQERAQTRHAANAGAEEGAHQAALAMEQVCCGALSALPPKIL